MKENFPRDERLESLKYKAGFYAFYIFAGLMWLILTLTFFAAKNNFEFLFYSSIGALIFSGIIYELLAREYLDYVQAMKMKNPGLRRREKFLLMARFFAGATMMFAWRYSDEKKFLPAILYSVIFAGIMSIAAWLGKNAAKDEIEGVAKK